MTNTRTPALVASAARPASGTARLGWVLGLTSTAYFMVVLDSSVVLTALPRMQHDLHASLASLQWTVDAYSLAFAVRILTARARRPVRAAADARGRPDAVHPHRGRGALAQRTAELSPRAPSRASRRPSSCRSR